MFNKDEVRALIVIVEKAMALEEKIKDKKGKGDITLLDLDAKPITIGGVSTVGPALSMATGLLSCIAFSIATDSIKHDKEAIRRFKNSEKEK